jgi:hypothetical protein
VAEAKGKFVIVQHPEALTAAWPALRAQVLQDWKLDEEMIDSKANLMSQVFMGHLPVASYSRRV